MCPTRPRIPIGRYWQSAIVVSLNYALLVMTSARRVGGRIEAEDQFPTEYQEKTRLLEIRVVLFPNTDERLESGLFLENDLGFFAVVPKIGLCRELV